MATTQHEANIINEERQRMADQMTEKLKKLGVDVHVAHYTGDSSYPTEYTISYQSINAVGPTFDLALLGWIEKMLEIATKPASSYQAMERAFKTLAHGLSALHTDVKDIKVAVVQDSEEN